MSYSFDLAPERTLALTLHCPFKGVERVGKVYFYVTKKNGALMAIPEAHVACVCRKAQPLGPVVWALKGRVEAFWKAHGRMPAESELRTSDVSYP